MPKGVVVTFYSYKGGVGRSFTLANVAVVLARWGYNVLCVDWDLEAPGLFEYFRPWIHTQPAYGLLEFVEEIAAGEHPSGGRLLKTVDLPGVVRRLRFVPAGKPDATYVSRMQEIDWAGLYDRRSLGSFIESLRTEWMEEHDFVLIDSRTGITDIAGICTVQLPDILLFMFTANNQSLKGAIDVVHRAVEARNSLQYDRAALLALPIPSRFESKQEYRLAGEWKQIFVKELAPFYTSWAVRETTPEQLVDRTTIPYFPYWSFGEQLPVIEETTKGPDLISYHFETLAAIVAHRLANSDLLTTSMDSYVDAARRAGLRGGHYDYDVFISYSRDSRKQAQEFGKLLSPSVRVFLDSAVDSADDLWNDQIESALSRSQHMLALIGPDLSRSQDLEINTFMRQTLDERSRRTVFPVLVNDASEEALPPLLSGSQVYEARPESMESIAADVIRAVGRRSQRPTS